MPWVLVVVYGITGWGAGGMTFGNYSSEESCYRALAAMRVNDSPIAESKDKKTVIAFCRPKEGIK